MHVTQLCQNLLRLSCLKIHEKRRSTLELLVNKAMGCTHISQARLARELPGQATDKANIKRVNLFVSNEKLWEERQSVYKATSHLLLATRRQRRALLFQFLKNYEGLP